MKPPRFWFKPKDQFDLRAIVLTPLSWVYRSATKRRLQSGQRLDVGVPVICVGNINMGGTGKTPTVIAVLEMLGALDRKAAVISRGYGGTLEGPVLVDEKKHTAADVGDEPILLSAFADVWVSKDRALGAKAAVENGAEVLILDDGLQNPALKYDLSLTVVDAEIGFGNHRVFPAGPLRESVEDGLARTDIIVSVGGKFERTGIPIVSGKLHPIEMGMDWKDAHVVAFAGIGRPEKFFRTLKNLGATLEATHAFGDHEPYSEMILTRLEREAFQKASILVTTEKDAARLPADWRHMVMSLPVRLKFEDPTPLKDRIKALF